MSFDITVESRRPYWAALRYLISAADISLHCVLTDIFIADSENLHTAAVVFALASPFTKAPAAAITPPAALSKQLSSATTLAHRFWIFTFLIKSLAQWSFSVKSDFSGLSCIHSRSCFAWNPPPLFRGAKEKPSQSKSFVCSGGFSVSHTIRYAFHFSDLCPWAFPQPPGL